MYYGEVRIPNSDLEPFIRTATSLKIKGLSTQFSSPSKSAMTSSTSTTTTTTTTNDAQHATPPKKRRHSNDERRVSTASQQQQQPSSAFTAYENAAQLRLPQQQQQQQRLSAFRPESRLSPPVRGSTPPSRILQENRTQPTSRHHLQGNKW